MEKESNRVSWLGKTAKSLFIFLFFSFLIGLITIRWSGGKYYVTDGHRWSQSQCVAWGPRESKCIATVVKCISSRELSENSIEFSLSNSEQRDSWLNSGHRTLDADTGTLEWVLDAIAARKIAKFESQSQFQWLSTPISINLPNCLFQPTAVDSVYLDQL